MTPSALILSLIAGFAFIAAVNVQSGWLFLVCDALLALILASLILGGMRLRGISLSVQKVAPSEAGKTAQIPVTLRHLGRPHPLLLLLMPPLGKRPLKRWFYSQLEPSGWASAAIPLLENSHSLILELETPRRGEHPLPPLVLLSSPMGYWVSQRIFSVNETVLVTPQIVRLLGLPWLRYASKPSDGPPRPRAGGDLFRGLRDYRIGDSLRQVHWKSSAKRGELLIKETESEVAQTQVHLVLDPQGPSDVIEQVFSVAASIVVHLERLGFQASLESAWGSAPEGPPAQLEWLARHPEVTGPVPQRQEAILISGAGQGMGSVVLNCGYGAGGHLHCPPGCDLARVLGA